MSLLIFLFSKFQQIIDDLNAHGPFIEKLKRDSHGLESKSDAPAFKALVTQVKDLYEVWLELSKEAREKLETLEKWQKQIDDYEKNVDDLNAWIDRIESSLSAIGMTSVLTELEDQREELKVFELNFSVKFQMLSYFNLLQLMVVHFLDWPSTLWASATVRSTRGGGGGGGFHQKLEISPQNFSLNKKTGGVTYKQGLFLQKSSNKKCFLHTKERFLHTFRVHKTLKAPFIVSSFPKNSKSWIEPWKPTNFFHKIPAVTKMFKGSFAVFDKICC